MKRLALCAIVVSRAAIFLGFVVSVLLPITASGLVRSAVGIDVVHTQYKPYKHRVVVEPRLLSKFTPDERSGTISNIGWRERSASNNNLMDSARVGAPSERDIVKRYVKLLGGFTDIAADLNFLQNCRFFSIICDTKWPLKEFVIAPVSDVVWLKFNEQKRSAIIKASLVGNLVGQFGLINGILGTPGLSPSFRSLRLSLLQGLPNKYGANNGSKQGEKRYEHRPDSPISHFLLGCEIILIMLGGPLGLKFALNAIDNIGDGGQGNTSALNFILGVLCLAGSLVLGVLVVTSIYGG